MHIVGAYIFNIIQPCIRVKPYYWEKYNERKLTHNTNVSTHNGGYKCSCPSCGSEDVELNKNNFTALGTIKREMNCKTCGYNYETSNSAYRTFIEHKNNTPLI